MTEFMKETQNENPTRSREKSMMRTPFWDKSKSKEKELSNKEIKDK